MGGPRAEMLDGAAFGESLTRHLLVVGDLSALAGEGRELCNMIYSFRGVDGAVQVRGRVRKCVPRIHTQ